MLSARVDQNDNSKYQSNTFAAYIRNWVALNDWVGLKLGIPTTHPTKKRFYRLVDQYRERPRIFDERA